MTLIEKTAKKLDIPEEQVEMVVSDLWSIIHHYLTHPEKVKFGILLPFFRIDLHIYHILNEIEKRFHKMDKIDYWTNILKSLPYGKSSKQVRIKKNIFNRLAKAEASREQFDEFYITRKESQLSTR